MATTQTVMAADPKHYAWWFPGSPVKVHLALQVVQRLKQRLSDHGLATSEDGLLFGRMRDGVTEILDFQPAADISIPSMVAAVPTDSNRCLLGYYRTEEGDSFRLNRQDLILAEECFRKPYQVFLIMHSTGFGSPTATFFFRDADHRMVDVAFLEFPFDPSVLAIEENDRIHRSQAAAQDLVVPSPAPHPTAVDGRRRKRGTLLRAAGWTCCVALVFALGMTFNNRFIREQYSRIRSAISNPTPASSSNPGVISIPRSAHSSMALHAIRQNGDLELTWNPESAPISAATSGMVSIQDGESQRRVPLDLAQLRGGSILYSPTSDQILMQLTVTTPAEAVTESVTAILPKVRELPTYPRSILKPLSSVMPSPSKPTLSQPTSSQLTPSLPLGNTPPVKSSKPFSVPAVEKAGTAAMPLVAQDPPTVGINPTATQTVLPGFDLQEPKPLPSALASPKPLPALAAVTYAPPVAVVKTPPAFPSELRNLIVTRTVVQVKVTIDENGRVTKTEAVPQKNVHTFLLNAAANAARSWRFQPAQRNHQSVPSESLLQFVFSR